MSYVISKVRVRQTAPIILALLFLQLPGVFSNCVAQTTVLPPASDSSQTQIQQPGFRLERIPLAGGAQLLTVFGSLDGLTRDKKADVPLISILRDTLGDEAIENDRLRYVWMHSYTRPSVAQRAASAVPFLYSRVANKKRASKDAPPPHIIDLAGTEREVWHRLFWNALQTLVLNPYSFTVKATTHTFRRNADDYRKAHIIRALAS